MVSSRTTYAAVYSNGYKKATVSYTVNFTNRDGNGKIAAYPTINGTSISGSGSTIVNLTNLDSFRIWSGYSSESWSSYLLSGFTVELYN